MKNFDNALRKAYPEVAMIWYNDDTTFNKALDAAGDPVEIDLSLVEVEQEALNLEEQKQEYKSKRKAEYDAIGIGDQLDAIWKGGDEMEAMRSQIMAIKARHSKPEDGGE